MDPSMITVFVLLKQEGESVLFAVCVFKNKKYKVVGIGNGD